MSGDDVPDPATGLTKREKDILRATWGEIQKDKKEYGFDLFIRFFTENPTYVSKFSAFKDVPIGEMRGNKKVSAHATNVLYAISALIDNLDDPECLVNMLIKLGGNHFRHGIQFSMFENLGSSLIGSMSTKLGTDVMNDAAVEAWKKAYGVIISVIKQGLDEAAASA